MTLRRGTTLTSLVVALGVALAGAGGAATSDKDAATHAAQWFVARQRADGSFASGQGAQDTAQDLAAISAGGAGDTPVNKALSYISNKGPGATTEGVTAGF